MSKHINAHDVPKRKMSPWVLRIFIVTLAVIGLILVLGLGFLAGALHSEHRLYQEQYERERALIEPLLNADPEFNRVTMYQHSSGGVFCGGYVASNADLVRLHTAVGQLVGAPRAKEILRAVLIWP